MANERLRPAHPAFTGIVYTNEPGNYDQNFMARTARIIHEDLLLRQWIEDPNRRLGPNALKRYEEAAA